MKITAKISNRMPNGKNYPRAALAGAACSGTKGVWFLVLGIWFLGFAGTAEAAHCGACRYPVCHHRAEQCCMPEVRYKVCYQTVIEERTKTCYRPVYQTVMRECRYTVCKPVYEQHFCE